MLLYTLNNNLIFDNNTYSQQYELRKKDRTDIWIQGQAELYTLLLQEELHMQENP